MWHKLKIWLVRITVRFSHKGESLAHMSYLGLVGWEAHGNYRWAAIILLGFVLHNTLFENE